MLIIMSFQNKLKEVDLLQRKIEEYGKLSKELLQKINYKFRLDWNYFSNRMEGNTLTIDETKSVMIGNINVRNKPLKDVMEMKGHDEAIQAILQMGKGELNISEGRIKNLHGVIMYEDSPGEKDKIGKWKIHSNHIFNYKDERFDFTDPSEVPGKMHTLINWINSEKEKIQAGKKDRLHPAELAFEFHLQYLTIHPFYDGNGRTGRILTNLILISYGYPPIYIKDTEKAVYYRYLADVQAYGSDRFMLFKVMAEYLLRSLNIVSNAIDGKDIEEPDDLDKKLQLLERELSNISPDDELKMKYSLDTFLACYEAWIGKLIILAVPVIQKFNRFFTGINHHVSLTKAGIYIYFDNQPVSEIKTKFEEGIQKESERIGQIHQEFRIQTFYGNLIKGGLKSFGCNYSITIKFDEFKYELFVDDLDETTGNRITIKKYERLLHQELTDEEMNDTVSMLGNVIFKHIDYYTKKNGLRQ
jgi:Fic family protein